MAKRIDLRSRVDEVTISTPTGWDPKIARAVIQRREQELVARPSPEHPASGTSLLEARLAEARARKEAEAATTD